MQENEKQDIVKEHGLLGPRAERRLAPARCSVETTSRQVIEHKLLTALENGNTVAAILSKQDLQDMIGALYGYGLRDATQQEWDAYRKRCDALADGMSQLLTEAFPPNADLSDPAS